MCFIFSISCGIRSSLSPVATAGESKRYVVSGFFQASAIRTVWNPGSQQSSVPGHPS
jgi:hypothetical protein